MTYVDTSELHREIHDLERHNKVLQKADRYREKIWKKRLSEAEELNARRLQDVRNRDRDIEQLEAEIRQIEKVTDFNADRVKELENLNGWAQVVKLTEALDELTVWLNNNTTFYDTEGMSSAVPVLASVSKRIWYHATDDTESYPFSDVIKTEREHMQ